MVPPVSARLEAASNAGGRIKRLLDTINCSNTFNYIQKSVDFQFQGRKFCLNVMVTYFLSAKLFVSVENGHTVCHANEHAIILKEN